MHTIRIIDNAIAVLDGESSVGTCSVSDVNLRREAVAVRESLEHAAAMGLGLFSLTLHFIHHTPKDSKMAIVVGAIEAMMGSHEVVAVKIISSYVRVAADFVVMQFHENMAVEDGLYVYSFALREVRRALVC